VSFEEGREKDLPMCGLFLAIGECPGRSKRVRYKEGIEIFVELIWQTLCL
jgi:hypothetical protein